MLLPVGKQQERGLKKVGASLETNGSLTAEYSSCVNLKNVSSVPISNQLTLAPTPIHTNNNLKTFKKTILRNLYHWSDITKLLKIWYLNIRKKSQH